MKTLIIRCFLMVLGLFMLLTSVVAAPQPGVCYFGDSDGDCIIDFVDVNNARKSVLLKAVDYSGVTPQSPDVQDLNGNGAVDAMDVRLLRGLMLLKSVDIAGAPTKINIVNAPTQLDINDLSTVTVRVTDNDGTPRAGIGVLFTIDDISTGTATLTGRDPLDGNNIITSNSVFELTSSIKDGGEATVTINPLTTGTLMIKTFVPGDSTKGIDDINFGDITISMVDGEGTITNSAPVFDLILPVTAYSNELIQFTISATDADADGLTYDLVSGPGNLDSETQTYTWTPSQSDKINSATSYNLVFSTSDGIATVEQNVIITLVNRMPEIFGIEDIIIDENGLVSISPVVTDLDNDELTITYSDKLDLNGEWQTDFNSAGSYNIVAIVSDGVNSAGRSFTINVNDVVQNSDSQDSGTGSSSGSNAYHDYSNNLQQDVNKNADEVINPDEDLIDENEIKSEEGLDSITGGVILEDSDERSILSSIGYFVNKVFIRFITFIKNLF